MQLARVIRNCTIGVLYVLDKPLIGLHPFNLDSMMDIVEDMIRHGNSVMLVDHDTRASRRADWLIEMSSGAGIDGGAVVSQDTVAQVSADPGSIISLFLKVDESTVVRQPAPEDGVFSLGKIRMFTGRIHIMHPLEVRITRWRMTVVTMVSDSWKTTMILKILVPALGSMISGNPLPFHVKSLDIDWVRRANVIDAIPIGTNVHSIVATYSGVLDELRRMITRTADAKA